MVAIGQIIFAVMCGKEMLSADPAPTRVGKVSVPIDSGEVGVHGRDDQTFMTFKIQKSSRLVSHVDPGFYLPRLTLSQPDFSILLS